LTLLEVFIFCRYGPPSTGEYNSLPTTQTTKLLKLLNNYLLLVTFENGKNYSTQYKIANNGPVFDSIQNEKKHY